MKKSFGAYGRGNALVERAPSGALLLNGEQTHVNAIVTSLDQNAPLGWILQQPLQAHPELVRLTGNPRVSGLRVHTLLDGNDVLIAKAMLKINMGRKHSDNFEHGVSGNLLAAVDPKSGLLERVIAGVGLAQQTLAHHPITNERLTGFQVPFWRETASLLNRLAPSFPGFVCPGWDIAICPDGPVVLEVNAFGDVDLTQHAYRAPFLDEQMLQFLARKGLLHALFRRTGHRRKSKINGRYGIRKHHWPW